MGGNVLPRGIHLRATHRAVLRGRARARDLRGRGSCASSIDGARQMRDAPVGVLLPRRLDVRLSSSPSSRQAPCAKPFVPSGRGRRRGPTQWRSTSPKLTSIESSMVDGLGRPVRVACVTCHGVRDAGPGSRRRELAPGISCGAHCPARSPCVRCLPRGTCRRDADAAPGRRDGGGDHRRDAPLRAMPWPRYQDYLHGSHGGMNGYWDLSRVRASCNHCVILPRSTHRPEVPTLPAGAAAERPLHEFTGRRRPRWIRPSAGRSRSLGGTLRAALSRMRETPLRAWAKDLTLGQFLQHYKGAL